MEKQIRAFINKHTLIPKKSNIILGLSGGPDSVYLLDLLSQLKAEGLINKLVAAHVDHEWRTGSDKDTQFCAEIAKKYHVPLATKKLSELGLKLKFEGSKEEFGRKARRYFFEQLAKKHDANLIALAHHAQDQQETFFIRLIRGSSLSGLTGMNPKHGLYIRPLLETNKQEIVDFLDKNNIPYLIDPSNVSQEFLRNRIRMDVIPALKKCDARFDIKFKETLDRLIETEQFLEQITKETFEQIATEKKGIFYINLKKLLSLHPALRYRILVYWLCKQNVTFPVGIGFLNEILKFLKQPGSKEHQIHPSWSLIKKKGTAHIRPASY